MKQCNNTPNLMGVAGGRDLLYENKNLEDLEDFSRWVMIYEEDYTCIRV